MGLIFHNTKMGPIFKRKILRNAPTPLPQQERRGTENTDNGSMKTTLCSLLLGLCTIGSPAALAETPQTHLPRTQLRAGMHLITAQVAATPEQRSVGLMWRRDMPANEGMLFVFERPAQQCFWMKNTLLPLTAAFVEDDGTITNLADMKPQTTDSHCSTRPVRFVLEMNQGWFAKRGIAAGQRLQGAAFGTPTR